MTDTKSKTNAVASQALPCGRIAPRPRRRLLRRLFWLGLLGVGSLLIADGVYLKAKAQLAQLLLERSYQRLQRGAGPAPPWPWADTHAVARLQVVELGIDQIVLAGASMRNLAFGPVIVAGGDELDRGHIWLSGHRDTHFAFLETLRPGMELRLEMPRMTRRFIVAATDVADVARDEVAMDSEADALTLSTCYPFDALLPGTTLRFIVSAIGA